MKAYVLLVEENPGDAESTQATFDKNRIINEIVVLSDGAPFRSTKFEPETFEDFWPRSAGKNSA